MPYDTDHSREEKSHRQQDKGPWPICKGTERSQEEAPGTIKDNGLGVWPLVPPAGPATASLVALLPLCFRLQLLTEEQVLMWTE